MRGSQAPRPQHQRELAAQHVAYELGILRAAFVSVRGQGLNNVVMLESFLLHTRNLIEFFWDGAPRGTILPKDFGAPRARDKDPGIRALHEEISQLLTHLTWARVDVHALRPQDWSYPRLSRIFDAVTAKARGFLGGLPETERAWFTCTQFPNEFRYWLR